MTAPGDVENIRVADDLLVDLLFAANGESFESMQPYVRELQALLGESYTVSLATFALHPARRSTNVTGYCGRSGAGLPSRGNNHF